MNTNSNTISSVLVGVDGSDASLRAVEWAAQEAKRHAAPLEIRACYTVPFYGEPGMFGAYGVESQVDAIKLENEQIVKHAEELAQRVASGVAMRANVVFAPAAVSLTEVGEETLIVVGTSGRTGAIVGVLGSITTAVAHRAQGPVVVVPNTADITEGGTMKKIVVGIDGSPESAAATRWALEEARLSGAELTVLHGWSYPYSGGPVEEIKQDALRQLELAVDSVGESPEHDVKLHAKLVEGHPAEALIEEAKDADLLVVGSRGRGGFKAMLLGSVSRAVVQHATCPVAVIRHRSE